MWQYVFIDIIAEGCGYDPDPEEACGEMCHFSAEIDTPFYCDQGHRCCPTLPQGDECSEACQVYDSKSKWQTNTTVIIKS